MSRPLFTKRHYDFLAKAIQDMHSEVGISWSDVAEIADYMADKLEQTNDKFNSERFMKACGVTPNGSALTIISD